MPRDAIPLLTIRITRQADGATLACVRRDGTVTWQRQRGTSGAFFPRHDLTHYVLESVLGHRRGFYGLVADGWDLGDFGAPWPRGPIPADADPSELLVGFLDVERASVAGGAPPWTAADLSEQAAAWYAARGLAGPPVVSDEQLAEIRARRSALFARWNALAVGETLELPFALGEARAT